ncbi:SLC13 family permease [Hominifimenecus sp. rT4P-3]|uniref:SLC13 family permease n=1 Tax=Hominifimenecus sp. rT4P-3 TaxID=3242979 RepID=UPI003DA30040
MKKLLAFFKKETVLCVALMLAVFSMFLMPPDGDYLGYIDFRTLAILFCLMCVMAGLQKIGVFNRIAQKLLGQVRSGSGLVLTLVLLCFFFSMLITNDVALITFVPFTFIVLRMLGTKLENRLLVPVVVLQTIGANLGSMLTPIGNPQNLYLYGKAGVSMGEFFLLMLPYTLLSLALLVAFCVWQGRACPQFPKLEETSSQELSPVGKRDVYQLALYLALFLFCLLAVGNLLPWQAIFVVVLITILATDRRILTKVDYSLLLTFVGFFIFIGNVGRVPAFRAFLQSIIAGREIYTAIIASQVISNVPAALLLSGFTEDMAGLIVGTNLGGLGTLIASMASLISYKHVAKEAGERKGKYIAFFTAGNLVFLAALMGMNLLIWF